MSFTSMHNDYLDPDKHNFTPEDYMSDILKEMKKWSNNKWQWDKIHLCWTGKDADLDAGGQQGIELIDCDDEFATFVIHAYKTVVGDDVSLNTPQDITSEALDMCLKMYKDQMCNAVCDSGCHGEWDGDSWGMSFTSDPIRVKIVPNDPEKTIKNILKKVQSDSTLKNWEREMCFIDRTGDLLSGWRYINGHRCKEGKPCKESVYAMTTSVTSNNSNELENVNNS